jgi:hypothetical protein
MNYDLYASQARAEYESFAHALIADYLSHSAAGRDLHAVGTFRMSGLALVARFVGRATALTNDYLAPLGGGGFRDAREHPYLNALRQLAIKNLNDLIVRLMGGSNRLADTLTRPAGAIGLLLQQRLAKPELVALDKSGRRWPADKLVAVMTRDFAYQAYLDAEIELFKGEGVETVMVVYPDSTHNQHGRAMRLDDVGLVRKSIFHPNSQARLVPYVPT